jgi:hypothetical protein
MTGTAVAVDARIALGRDAVKPPAVTGLRARPCQLAHPALTAQQRPARSKEEAIDA